MSARTRRGSGQPAGAAHAAAEWAADRRPRRRRWLPTMRRYLRQLGTFLAPRPASTRPTTRCASSPAG